MFIGEEDMQATAPKAKGWSISGIARHLEHDRATIRRYLSGSGERVAGERKREEPDPFEQYVPYLRAKEKTTSHFRAAGSSGADGVVAAGLGLVVADR